MANDQVEVTVRRLRGYVDLLRAYRIKVDGVEQGSVRANGTVTIGVSPGSHVLTAAIDWCSSNQVRFQAIPGKRIAFECGSSMVGWRVLVALVYVLFRRNEYLWLRPVA